LRPSTIWAHADDPTQSDKCDAVAPGIGETRGTDEWETRHASKALGDLPERATTTSVTTAVANTLPTTFQRPGTVLSFLLA
jgi:hypothetical protein